MNILLTGGTGNVGRTAVTRLVQNGHTVRVIGRRSGVTIEGAEYVACDTTDYAKIVYYPSEDGIYRLYVCQECRQHLNISQVAMGVYP